MASTIVPVTVLMLLLSVSFSVPVDRDAIPTISRRWVEGGPCGRSDSSCMNNMAFKYVNKIRAEAGVGPLEMGTMYMFQNAMKHTKVMMNAGNIFHQEIQNVVLGRGSSCETGISGENVAQSFVPFNSRKGTDPAMECVKLWKGSRGHYENMISRDFKNTVIAVILDSSDKIWCTQTFSTMPAKGSGMCGPASKGASSPPSPTKKTEQQPAEKHTSKEPAPEPKKEMPAEAPKMEKPEKKPSHSMPKPTSAPMKMGGMEKGPKKPMGRRMCSKTYGCFKNYRIITRGRFGRRVLVLRCWNGRCRYCSAYNRWKCYSEQNSIFLDHILTSYRL